MRCGAASRRSSWALLFVVIAAACSANTPTSAERLAVSEKDFKVSPNFRIIHPGLVTLDVTNLGPSTHELVLVRTDSAPGELPIGRDGLSVDEDRVQPVGELGEVDAGVTDQLSVSLTPGHYVLFCNLEGHYLAGMHAGFQVTDG